MAEQQPRPGAEQRPVPRDMPDQQARPNEDPWDVAPGRTPDDEPDENTVPDTDEAGTGRRGATDTGTAHSDHPAPQEPSG
ncbi:hypothetical protein ABZ923_20520 [Streptomyces sp. NPDC046881]|uniref:hypothetical protein n=1 Tax=Streptomyces sp. NPDC046881 TaxID=3155374 RepID=UPI0033F51E5F